ncbi:thiamine pyrophosphate-binding protein [Litchfieldia alkalitelluris]|uniref:thiamine pyrophosphate-binding protein n=1 Tax=Litchfieldia alkalitelluris TaxID=304268 RepID=UPI0009972E18|nr:thiamine pyrophosphate-binding protein [Litchfieldia alkalitelluris]
MLQPTVASLMLNQLEAWGVQRIYGVVGDAILGLMDAIGKQKSIQFIAVKHESVAAMMASAEAKLTGNIGVCAATMGPGLGNLLNGLGDAYLDKAPVLAITGQAPTTKIGTDYKQYIDQQEFIKPLALYTSLATHPDSISDLLVKAIHTSVSQGAVSHLSVPKDLFTMQTKAKVIEKPLVIKGVPSLNESQNIKEISNIMNNAKHPMILCGDGAINSTNLITNLSLAWGAGILVSLGAKGYFDHSTKTLLGGIGQGGNPYAKELFENSDVVLLVGDTWWPEGYVPKNALVIQIDMTEENIGKGIPVKYGVVGMAEEILPEIIKAIPQERKNENWLDKIMKAKEKWNKDNEKERTRNDQPLHPARIVRAIEENVNEDAILSIDTGDVTVWMNRNFQPTNQTFLFSGKWRTMGFGLPGALAAKLIYPDKQVVAVVGDGGIEMTLADLLTAVRYELDITVIIFNNHALQMEKDKMIVGGYEQEGVGLTNPNFATIAEACGWKGYNISSENELNQVISEAISVSSPTLISIDTAAIVHPETKS